MMRHSSVILMSVVLAASLVSSRVLKAPAPDQPSLNDLLQQADPLENDIFFEPMPASQSSSSRPTSPASHLLSAFSPPRYVDASEFRLRERLPPALDINRQLTILSASKHFAPPAEESYAPEEQSYDTDYETSYLPEAAPLFREDFPSDSVVYYDYVDEQANNDTEEAAVDSAALESSSPRRILTSVSVSASVTYPNGTSATIEPSEAAALTSGSDITTEGSTTTSTTETATKAEQDEATTESEAKASNAPKALSRVTLYENPSQGALSPLSHILAGFGGELGAFGGDRKSDSFISHFRPDGYF